MMSNIASSESKPTPIRVEINPSLPSDPLQIQSMADYDLTLCLYRTWFEYDESRRAKPGIVSRWSFDSSTGAYRFLISENAHWSDGSPVTAQQLLLNLRRSIELKTSYGVAIKSLIRLEHAKELSPKEFTLPTRDGKPSELFFQRMGSSFLAIVHPSDLDSGLKVITNHLSNGPYKIASADAHQIHLVKNSFDGIANVNRPSEIQLRRESSTNLSDFVAGKSWATVIQTATLMPKTLSDQIITRKLPYWTRGFDRVSKLKPLGKGEVLKRRREFVRAFGRAWAGIHIEKLPFNASKALSLQPQGYPLFQPVDFSKAPVVAGEQSHLPTNVKIIVGMSPQYEIQKPLVAQAAQSLGVQVEWVPVRSAVDVATAVKQDPEIGFDIFNFGVADPEPTTWMGLVLNPESVFVDVTPEDLAEFNRISHLNVKEQEATEYRALLTSMALRGSYVPLFHFSTLSLGQPGISFENIHELDETVDYSKLILKP
jgi:MarR-like DNA-binding transcriptional regulator SgrR of sgrS sRNA